MIVILETRYGGVYEGGPWAAFSVASPASVPEDAFGGDAIAATWWGAPTMPVGVGDSPDDAHARLEHVLDRDRRQGVEGLFEVGADVRVAATAPSDFRAGEVGRVRSVEFRPIEPFAGGLRGLCVYELDFPNGGEVRIEEAYLRPAGAA